MSSQETAASSYIVLLLYFVIAAKYSYILMYNISHKIIISIVSLVYLSFVLFYSLYNNFLVYNSSFFFIKLFTIVNTRLRIYFISSQREVCKSLG